MSFIFTLFVNNPFDFDKGSSAYPFYTTIFFYFLQKRKPVNPFKTHNHEISDPLPLFVLSLIFAFKAYLTQT